jgi:hypothetical protein
VPACGRRLVVRVSGALDRDEGCGRQGAVVPLGEPAAGLGVAVEVADPVGDGVPAPDGVPVAVPGLAELGLGELGPGELGAGEPELGEELG